MRQLVIVLTILMVVVIVLSVLSGASAVASERGVLSVLKVGQTILVQEVGEKFQLKISTRKLISNYRVVEVGQDYLVVSNKPKLQELRIPLSSIKCVIHDKR
jgi:hypothetical protein